MTRVSKGCISCKARRRRCGREIPACRQCVKAGLTCVGMVPDHERFFVVSTSTNFKQDTTNAGRKLVLGEPRSNAAAEEKLAPVSCTAVLSRPVPESSSIRESFPRIGCAPLCRGPNSNIEMLALGSYMSDNGGYSAMARDLLRPFDGFFRTEYPTQVSNHSAFKYSSEALTLLDYSYKVRSNTVKARAIARYGLALRSVQASIEDISSNVGRFKALLDSVWIMVQIEAKLQTPSSAQNCRTHMNGVFDIIRQTAPGAMQTYRQKTNRGRVLDGAKKLSASLDELILLSMQTKQAVPHLGSWIVFVLENAGPPEKLSLIASEIPELQARANTILQRSQPTEDMAIHLLVANAIEVDHRLLIWRHALPIEWTALAPSHTIGTPHVSSNLPITMLINQWRVWRMHIWLLVWRCVKDRGEVSYHDHLIRAGESLRKLVDGIIDSAGVYFHSVAGDPADDQVDPDVPSLALRVSKLLGLLLFASRVPCLPVYQILWLQERILMLQTWCNSDWTTVTPFVVEHNFLAH